MQILKGEHGEHVKKVQQKLIDLGYELPLHGSDGVYGTETEVAVLRFQKDNNLPLQGAIIDATTYDLLMSSAKVIRSSDPINSAPVLSKTFNWKMILGYGAFGVGLYFLFKNMGKRK